MTVKKGGYEAALCLYGRKKVMTLTAIQLPQRHTTTFEIYVQIRMGRDRYAQASR
jgi:hypothetical protein